MKVLIAEDDVHIARSIRDGLDAAGHLTHIVRDGSRVLPLVQASNFSLVLLDIMLPGMNGFDICKQLRANQITTPVLMLTARDSLDDRVRGLDCGADDYLSKPFEFPELLARMRALYRRHHTVKASEIAIGDLYINTAQHVVKRGEKELHLTPREYTLLEALAQQSGAVLSKEQIAENVWFDEFTTGNTVEVHVKNLRRKVDEGFEHKLIQTVYGVGYTLKALE